MNNLIRAKTQDLPQLANTAVERALAARQQVASLDADQAGQVGGGLPVLAIDGPAQRTLPILLPIVWAGMWLPPMKPTKLI